MDTSAKYTCTQGSGNIEEDEGERLQKSEDYEVYCEIFIS